MKSALNPLADIKSFPEDLAIQPRGGCLGKCLPIPNGYSSTSSSSHGSHHHSHRTSSTPSPDYGPFTTGHRHAGFHSPSSRGSSASPPLPPNHSPTQIGRMLAGKYLKPWKDEGRTHWHGHNSRSSSAHSSPPSSADSSPRRKKKKEAGPR